MPATHDSFSSFNSMLDSESSEAVGMGMRRGLKEDMVLGVGTELFHCRVVGEDGLS